MQNSKIEWTDHTFNPWWGCTKVSPGCQHCYAEGIATRFGGFWGPRGLRRPMSESYWNEPRKWDRAAAKSGRRPRVFCASMADVFEDNAQIEGSRTRLWELIDDTPHLDWLLLTKRPENITRMAPARWLEEPPASVWYGTSVENQEYAERRIPPLVAVPAVVRFLSCEPLLGPVDLAPYLTAVQWVITGGESGRAARPADPAWFRTIRQQCDGAGVAFFHKQNGGSGAAHGGHQLDGRLWHAWPPQLART